MKSMINFLLLSLIALMSISHAESDRNLRNVFKTQQEADKTTSKSRMKEVIQRMIVKGHLDTEREFLSAYLDGYDHSRSSEGLYGDTLAGIKIEYLTNNTEVMNLKYYVHNGPTNCTNCLIVIHRGRKCSRKRGRFFNKSDLVKKNPWTYKNGAVAITDEEGTGDNNFNITNGYKLEDNQNRVVVIYDGHRIKMENLEKRPKAIACGVLKKVSP